MDDSISPLEYKESECSGRALATLLIVWVSAAMIASVLLRWKYMWIALAVLTLLFLLVCGYAAYTGRRTRPSEIIAPQSRTPEPRRNIQSVSAAAAANCSETGAPPAYQSYWITDLPPSYAVVVGALPRPSTGGDVEAVVESSPRRSNPPPYSLDMQPPAQYPPRPRR